MFDPEVRAATVDDAAVLVALEAEARAALVDARGGARWLDEHPLIGDSWSDVLCDDDASTFVAELDAVGLGYMLVMFEPNATARIDQVWVTPGARQVGFGDRMMELAVAAGRSRSCLRIEGQALPGDRDTKNLYERAGITARLIVLSAAL